jgi:hypothetical protein
MGSEAARPGEIRVGDLRAVYGPSLRAMDHVDVLVAGRGGSPPAAGRIELVLGPAGRGQHVRLVCPSCGGAKLLLLARGGVIGCRVCLRHRTRRQLEKNLADWNRRGGHDEDQLFRYFQPARRLTAARLAEAARLARALVDADCARLHALQLRLSELSARVEHGG